MGKAVDDEGGPNAQNDKGEDKEQNSSPRGNPEKKLTSEAVHHGLIVKDIPYPHTFSRKNVERQFKWFMDILKKLQINISFTEALEQMPVYAKFMKELLTKKRKFPE